MKKNRVNKFIKNPKKALFTLAWPILIAMLVQVMYNIVDTAFVGRLGADSIAALTFVFPLFFLIFALNAGLGTGMSSLVSRALGAKNKKYAENTAIHGLIISLIFAIFVFLFGIPLLEPLLYLFGATPSVLALSIDYMSIIFLGSIFVFPAYMINSLFNAQGDTKTTMKVQITALILNIIIDPIFIYSLGYGVKGAAIATVLAQLSSLIFYLYYLKKKSYVEINLGSFSLSYYIIKNILFIGIPASLMMTLMSIYIMFINRFMSYFGTDYVAAFGIASRLESVAVMPVMAFAIAVMTLSGMFFGAKKYELIKSTIWYTIRFTISFAVIIGLIFFIFAPYIFRIFTSNPNLISIGSAYLRIDVFTFPIMAFGMIISRSLQGMGFGSPSLVINLVRVVLVSVPLAYIFVFVLNLSYLSIAVAMVIGGLCSTIVAFVYIKTKLKKIHLFNNV